MEDGRAIVRPGHPDVNGHGTACAALLAHLAPGAALYAVKIFDRELRAAQEALIAAIRWAVAERIPIINLSLGTVGGERLHELHSACREAVAAGSTLIAAAPQSGPPSYPATFEEVIAVGEERALGEMELRFVGRPGLDFLASGYARLQPGVPPEMNFKGPSFAAARVAAIAARLLAAEPSLSPKVVRERLRALAESGSAANGDARALTPTRQVD
jgi:subtilisin family serine protease